MTNQQKFHHLVANCREANVASDTPGVEERFDRAVWQLAEFVWNKEKRITVASEPVRKRERKPVIADRARAPEHEPARSTEGT
jgi:hypothetical protein